MNPVDKILSSRELIRRSRDLIQQDRDLIRQDTELIREQNHKLRSLLDNLKSKPAMNLLSCDNCGVILDANKLDFPVIEDYVPHHQAEWDGEKYVPVLPCPVCNHAIRKP